LIITLGFKKNAMRFTENLAKSLKIVIIALTPVITERHNFCGKTTFRLEASSASETLWKPNWSDGLTHLNIS
jgi:hypothetical protein